MENLRLHPTWQPSRFPWMDPSPPICGQIKQQASPGRRPIGWTESSDATAADEAGSEGGAGAAEHTACANPPCLVPCQLFLRLHSNSKPPEVPRREVRGHAQPWSHRRLLRLRIVDSVGPQRAGIGMYAKNLRKSRNSGEWHARL